MKKDSNVVSIGGVTKLDLEADNVLINLRGKLDGFILAGYDKDAPVYEFTKTQLEKFASLLREEFIKELGEPVAEAIRERDRLGFAVVNVIGKLDEIIENTQEVEIDDFLNIAVPIDMWNELQAALEDMPKRADLYTSPQPRDWVELSDNFIAETILENTKLNPNIKDDAETLLYVTNAVKAILAESKQLNTKG